MTGLQTALRGVIAAGLVSGAVLLAWPTSADGTEQLIMELAADPSLPPRMAADSLTMDVVMGNVFAASRTPPRRRFTPQDSGSVDESVPAMIDPAPNATTAGDGIPALLGTVVGENGVVMALLHLNAADPGPRLYAVGARDGGYRVVSIAPRTVILSGPQGRVSLRLPDEERP